MGPQSTRYDLPTIIQPRLESFTEGGLNSEPGPSLIRGASVEPVEERPLCRCEPRTDIRQPDLHYPGAPCVGDRRLASNSPAPRELFPVTFADGTMRSSRSHLWDHPLASGIFSKVGSIASAEVAYPSIRSSHLNTPRTRQQRPARGLGGEPWACPLDDGRLDLQLVVRRRTRTGRAGRRGPARPCRSARQAMMVASLRKSSRSYELMREQRRRPPTLSRMPTEQSP
jgi:hypothetical protein